MDEFKQKCKLCDLIISDENFKGIEGVMKNIFDILLLKLTLDNDTQNVICAICSPKLLAALNFKSTCLYTDNTIIPYVDFENPKLVDLKDIYAKEKGNKQGSKMLDDQEICRLCLKPMKSDHKSIQEVPVESIQIYIPEINFAVTTSTVICLKCHDALRVHSNFIRSCLDVEEKRNKDATDVGDMLLTDACIKTEEIEIKSEEMDETISEDLCNLNKEENEDGDTSLHSPNGPLDREETKRLTMGKYQCHTCMFNTKYTGSFVKHKLIHKRPSEVQMYGCDECDYKTIRKDNLLRHRLRHKDPSEVRMVKCDECNYKTIQTSHLKQHQLTHKDPSEVKMFKCDKCTYETKKKSNLTKHCLTHKDRSEVKRFKCDKCTFETNHKNRLVTHCLKYKDPSKVRVFQCDECDYKSIRKDSLKQHQLRHKAPSEVKMFKCDKCTFKTKHKNSFITHCLRHKDPSEVRMFECDECDYKSIRKYSLKHHQLTHKDPSEVKMFKCNDCDYKSIKKGNVKKHQVRHKNP